MGKVNWNVVELRRRASCGLARRVRSLRWPGQARAPGSRRACGTRRWLAVCGLVVGISAWSVVFTASAVLAQDDDSMRAVARQLGAEGIEAYQNEEYDVAETKLDRAYKLFPIPTLALWSARARVKMGRWVEASERYREATRASARQGDVAAQKQAKIEASHELEELVMRIPRLVVQVEGADGSQVSLQLDTAPMSAELVGLPRPTNPGAHVLIVTRASDHARQQRSVLLGERAQETVLFTFRAPIEPSTQPVTSQAQAQATNAALGLAPKPQAGADQRDGGSGAGVYRAIAIPALVVGGLGLVTWGVTGLMALSMCPKVHDCSESKVSSYNKLTTLSAVSFYAGGALVVGGAVTWLLAPSEKREPSAALRWAVGPGAVSVSGAF